MKKVVFTTALIIFSLACQVKRDNSENYFLRLEVIQNGGLKSFCYDRVYGSGRDPISNSCYELGAPINLPLNINADSCTFYFVKGSRTDYLKIRYLKTIRTGDQTYKLIMDRFKIYETSFDSLLSNCAPADTNFCSNQYDFKAFIVY